MLRASPGAVFIHGYCTLARGNTNPAFDASGIAPQISVALDWNFTSVADLATRAEDMTTMENPGTAGMATPEPVRAIGADALID